MSYTIVGQVPGFDISIVEHEGRVRMVPNASVTRHGLTNAWARSGPPAVTYHMALTPEAAESGRPDVVEHFRRRGIGVREDGLDIEHGDQTVTYRVRE